MPQDVPGLAKLVGGKAKLEASLDSLFLKNEYWHGNEPGHQIPFMYNYTNASWKTERYVHQILSNEYSDGPGGLSGNDDAGQMSAWYVFASLGFYPLNPVSGKYSLSSPIFDKVNITVSSGKKFRIVTSKNGNNARYISAIKLNGKFLRKKYIAYSDIMRGGTLEFFLSDKPGKN